MIGIYNKNLKMFKSNPNKENEEDTVQVAGIGAKRISRLSNSMSFDEEPSE